MANLVKFATGSSENYKSLATKDDNTLYFLNDTLQLYKGSEIYCKSYKTVDSLPATGAENTLYIVKSSKKL